MIFLKIYDAQEEKWELLEDDYTSIIPEELKWRNWAVDCNDGKALTGDELIRFVNDELIFGLKNLEVNENTPKRHLIVWQMFQDASNFMKIGTKLRQMINELNQKDFTNASDTHEFGDMYESMLKDLQESKRDGGEFYTPRALTDFIVEKVDPCLGERVADFACGTGGFLVSALKHLTAKVQTPEDLQLCRNNLFGIEKKSFPYSLCMTNLILHEVDEPKVYYDNSLNKNVREYKESDLFDVILMNPPYGGTEDEIIQMNFPQEYRASETADLFMAVIMYRLKANGRCGVVLPDGFLFGTEGTKRNLKEKLLKEFNLHTVLRLPKSVFAPYTSIATNVLFFEKDEDGTKNTWFYRLDIPADRKAFSKTKPIKSEHFQCVRDWWVNREEIQDEEGNYKARKFSFDELEAGNFNLDLCGYPHKVEDILEPMELISSYKEQRAQLNAQIDEILKEITAILENPEA
jgi:type I restriction enzyme M protein